MSFFRANLIGLKADRDKKEIGTGYIEPRAIELPYFSLKEGSLRVSRLTHLHARKINAFTVFAVADNVKNNETRGTVFLKYNEGDHFCNSIKN